MAIYGYVHKYLWSVQNIFSLSNNNFIYIITKCIHRETVSLTLDIDILQLLISLQLKQKIHNYIVHYDSYSGIGIEIFPRKEIKYTKKLENDNCLFVCFWLKIKNKENWNKIKNRLTIPAFHFLSILIRHKTTGQPRKGNFNIQ